MGLARWLGFTDRTKDAPEGRTLTSASVPWAQDGWQPFNRVGPLDSPLATATPQRALSLGAVYAAVRLIAQSVSTLPVKAYRRDGDGRTPMPSLPPLFDQLVSAGELVPWLHRCVTSLALRGNAYGLKVNLDGYGYPTQVEWLDPTLVTSDPRPGKSGWLHNGREVPRDQMVHIPLFALPGHKVGFSPIAAFAQTLGVGLSAQNYAGDWFAAGGFPPGTFRNEVKTVTPEEAEAIKARLLSAIRTHAPLVHGSDWKYEPISVPPEEAQFIQTMKLTTNQVAAIYGIPPEMIGGESGSSMTYANVEQQQINFVMFTLRPWLVTLEAAFSAWLPNRQYVKFNSDALIRADLKTRWEVNQIRLTTGAASVDEIRAQEDQPPLPDGQGQSYNIPAAAAPAGGAGSNPGGVMPTPLRRVQ